MSGLNHAFALAAAVILKDGTFDETPPQVSERLMLVARIATAQDLCRQRLEADPSPKMKRVVGMVWKALAEEANRELIIRKVNTGNIVAAIKGKQTR